MSKLFRCNFSARKNAAFALRRALQNRAPVQSVTVGLYTQNKPTTQTTPLFSANTCAGNLLKYTTPRVSVFNLNNKFYSSNEGPISVAVPELGDSITEAVVEKWEKEIGDYIEVDEVVCTLESDKVNQDMRSPVSGTLTARSANAGDTVLIGDDLFAVTPGEAPEEEEAAAETPKAEKKEKKEAAPKAEKKEEKKPAPKKQSSPKPDASVSAQTGLKERRVKMSRMRVRIAQRLKESQNTAAMLTTFQEVDMHELMAMRSQYKDAFLAKHDVKLGFMSCFVKASTIALQEIPSINAIIEGDEIVYYDDVDISVAVATPKGLVTPVLRDCGKMSFADVEKEIGALGQKARQGQITLADLSGGTFTISNGGVYGSLMGTPIINPPQSAILGMHGIVKRPFVVNNEIKIRPMMYLALTYDHRLIDGREAVTFLKTIKDNVEDPRRILLEV